MKTQRTWPGVTVESALVFLLAAALIWPLFKIDYTVSWYSIESTFIADGRFLKDHWLHPGWQPLWYCGTRFDYIYPPALRYGTAALSTIFPIMPVRAYHLYVAIFYCLGIAGVYLLVRIAAKSRDGAWLAAMAAGLLSPGFLFLKDVRVDSWHLAPQRLSALVRYGEGPHISAVALLPLALLFGFLALERWRPVWFALAALCCALIISTNFYGAVTLALFFCILAWSIWVTHGDGMVWARAAGIAALAYGLTAIWLVPSYVQITMRNMQFVALPGNTWSRWVAVAAAIAFGLISFLLARGRREFAYLVFVCGSASAFTLVVLGEHYFNFRVMGQGQRLIPELDLALILLAVEFLRRLWSSDLPGPRLPFAPSLWTRVAAIVIVMGSFACSVGYVRRAWQIYVPEPDYKQRVEYRVTDWMAKNLPHARSFAPGSIRFWYDTWADLAQVNGGSEQGLINPLMPQVNYFITKGQDTRADIAWMQALGVDAVIVPDKSSQEFYREFVDPRKFDGVLPAIYNDHKGNIIYKVPRHQEGLAHIVETRRMQSVQAITHVSQLDRLRAYLDVIKQGPLGRSTASWDGTDALDIRANIASGESILVQETYDPGWHAYARSRELPVHSDPLGFMWIEAPPGGQEIRLQFEMPMENRFGMMVTFISLFMVVYLVAPGFQKDAAGTREILN